MNTFVKKGLQIIPPVKRRFDEFQKMREEYYRLRWEAGYWSAKYKHLDQMFEDNIDCAWSPDSGKTRYVCAHPFSRLEICTSGEVFTCCSDHLKTGLYLGNAYEDSIDEIWNSDTARRLRFSVSKGRFEYCSHEYCPVLRYPRAYPGVMIQRESWDRDDSDWRDCAMDAYPSVINLACDETCNLNCVSCRSALHVNSSEENAKLSRMLESFVRPALKDCMRLSCLASGEFFASKPVFEFYRTLSKADYPKLTLGLITNGMLFTPERWGKLKNLKGMSIGVSVSVDAANKETYEKLRRGGKWEIICENMNYIASLKAAGEIRSLGVNFVVRDENFRQMLDFTALAKKWNADSVQFSRIINRTSVERERFSDMDVFSKHNPHYEEASRLLSECKKEADIAGIKVKTNY